MLDNFDAICSDLKIGLPAEIEKRRQQYEYYRDKLLTFDTNIANLLDKDLSNAAQFLADSGQRTADSGQRTADSGQRTADSGQRTGLIRLLQYVYGVAFLQIGTFSKLSAGATPLTSKKEYWENGTIAWMSSGEVNLGQVFKTEKCISQLGYDNTSTKMLPKNTVVVALAGQGKTRGTVAITRIPLCTNQSLCGIITNDLVDSEYLKYYLQTQYQSLRSVSCRDGARGGLTLKMISKYVVPVPSIEKQQRIVSILDRFDKLCNDISEGLPAEIEARQKLYEYYRDKLLSFKKA